MEPNADEHYGTKIANQAQAAQLLDAWIAGDQRRLDHLFSQFRETDLTGESQDDREELLRCVALQMKRSRSLFESRTAKPHLGVWIDTLTHLSGQTDIIASD
jgi:hypothetical protein